MTLSLLRGDLSLEDVALNEQVLQALLDLPPALQLREVRCSNVKISIPWSRLKREPVRITVGTVTVLLDEPPPGDLPPVAPLPPFLRKPGNLNEFNTVV